MVLIKKANSTTTTTKEIFTCNKNSMLFDAQNAGNRISELLDFKLPQSPPRGKGPCSLLRGHNGLLNLQWTLITIKVIEIRAYRGK